ncbi:MAG: nicotinate-nucleotide adenylyltransferase [Paramuribaculum sp.]|nr:nicotinate-nucleotide adenylyltransferase [Paramuribaculum sp.]
MQQMKTVGLYGGSFNPVHIGHLIVASYIAQWTETDEVWLMLSPLNPFKTLDPELIPAQQREDMLRLAVEQNDILSICDEQLDMPMPSYTIDTLDALSATHPDISFRCIIGSDSWLGFTGWKDWQRIINEYGVIIYPRPGYPIDEHSLPDGVIIANAPGIDISSTFIRNAIAAGKDVNYFVPSAVYRYIRSNNLYIK